MLTKTESMRQEIERLLHDVPFKPFVISLDNGDRVTIGHPENIAYDPSSKEETERANEFYVLSGNIRVFSSFEAVTNVSSLDYVESI